MSALVRLRTTAGRPSVLQLARNVPRRRSDGFSSPLINIFTLRNVVPNDHRHLPPAARILHSNCRWAIGSSRDTGRRPAYLSPSATAPAIFRPHLCHPATSGHVRGSNTFGHKHTASGFVNTGLPPGDAPNRPCVSSNVYCPRRQAVSKHEQIVWRGWNWLRRGRRPSFFSGQWRACAEKRQKSFQGGRVSAGKCVRPAPANSQIQPVDRSATVCV